MITSDSINSLRISDSLKDKNEHKIENNQVSRRSN